MNVTLAPSLDEEELPRWLLYAIVAAIFLLLCCVVVAACVRGRRRDVATSRATSRRRFLTSSSMGANMLDHYASSAAPSGSEALSFGELASARSNSRRGESLNSLGSEIRHWYAATSAQNPMTSPPASMFSDGSHGVVNPLAAAGPMSVRDKSFVANPIAGHSDFATAGHVIAEMVGHSQDIDASGLGGCAGLSSGVRGQSVIVNPAAMQSDISTVGQGIADILGNSDGDGCILQMNGGEPLALQPEGDLVWQESYGKSGVRWINTKTGEIAHTLPEDLQMECRQVIESLNMCVESILPQLAGHMDISLASNALDNVFDNVACLFQAEEVAMQPVALSEGESASRRRSRVASDAIVRLETVQDSLARARQKSSSVAGSGLDDRIVEDFVATLQRVKRLLQPVATGAQPVTQSQRPAWYQPGQHQEARTAGTRRAARTHVVVNPLYGVNGTNTAL